MSIAELQYWLECPDPKAFPYEAVMDEYHSVGKHFVPGALLDLLSRARSLLPELNGPWACMETLVAFLNTALDKSDKRYDYPNYLALALLPLPSVDDPPGQLPCARSRCDRILSQLMADLVKFELDALHDGSGFLPGMKPDAELVAKRCRLGLRFVRPVLSRLSVGAGITEPDQTAEALRICAAVRAVTSPTEQLALELSMMPVYTMHDEYLFLRVLQMFETTFALLATQLRGAILSLSRHDVDEAIRFLNSAVSALQGSSLLFSLLATMQVDSFRTFREFTEGASAIQSRNYKIVESLCRTPDRSRADSIAYQSVPEVLERLSASPQTVDGAYRAACSSDRLTDEQGGRLKEAMESFSRALLRWRRTHCSVAIRFLGEASGTGYTQGTPYLVSVADIPVFRSTAP